MSKKCAPSQRSGYRIVSLKELYRPIPYKKPRKLRRLRRRHARWFKSLSPFEQHLYLAMRKALHDHWREVVNRELLYGDGTEMNVKGIVDA